MAYHWVTFKESMQETVNTEEIVCLEKAYNDIRRKLDGIKATQRVMWLWEQLHENNVTIAAVPESGSTKAVFGNDIVIGSIETLFGDKGFIFTFAGCVTCITIKKNNAKLMDNGTMKFTINSKVHYLCISNWEELMKTPLIEGWHN